VLLINSNDTISQIVKYVKWVFKGFTCRSNSAQFFLWLQALSSTKIERMSKNNYFTMILKTKKLRSQRNIRQILPILQRGGMPVPVHPKGAHSKIQNLGSCLPKQLSNKMIERSMSIMFVFISRWTGKERLLIWNNVFSLCSSSPVTTLWYF
jgi:hypothetical protein